MKLCETIINKYNLPCIENFETCSAPPLTNSNTFKNGEHMCNLIVTWVYQLSSSDSESPSSSGGRAGGGITGNSVAADESAGVVVVGVEG